MAGKDNKYFQKFIRAMFPWGVFVAVSDFLIDLFFGRDTSGWSLWLAINKAVAFGLLFSVVMGYSAWRDERRRIESESLNNMDAEGKGSVREK
jgi:hypothetical protein